LEIKVGNGTQTGVSANQWVAQEERMRIAC